MSIFRRCAACRPDYFYRAPGDRYTCPDCGQGWVFDRNRGPGLDGQWVKAGRRS